MVSNTVLRGETRLPAPVGSSRNLQPPKRGGAPGRCNARSQQAPLAHANRLSGASTVGSDRHSISCSAAAAEAPELSSPLPGIEVKEAQLDKSRFQLTVTVPAAHVKKAWDKSLRKAASNLNVPGFRPGKKIPENVLFQYVDENEVKRDAMESLFTNSFKQVNSDYKKRAFGESFRMDDDGNELLNNFSPLGGFTYRVSFDIAPEVKWLGEYSKLKVEVEKPCADDEQGMMVEGQILMALKEEGKLRIVSERGLEKGDVAVIDFEARDKETGQPIAGTKREGMQLDTTLSDNSIGLPGLADVVVGMKVGESKTVDLQVPDTWWEKDRRGTTLLCDIALKELFTWEVPELTDELARKILPDCEGEEDLRNKLETAAAAVILQRTAQAVNNELTMAVADLIDVEVPESMVRELGTNEYQAQLLEMQTRGNLDMAAIQDLATEEMLELFINSRREELVKLQKSVLGFEDIFNREGLEIPEEEVLAEAEGAAAEAESGGEELDRELLLEQVREVLKASKVLEWLTDHADITLTDPQPDSESDTAPRIVASP